MPSLPNAGPELRSIRERLGGTVTSGASATEAALRATDLTKTDLLVFATHGVIGGQLAGVSEAALVFTPPAPGAAAPESNNGLLTASEIAAMRINADWVVLSACNTALGDSLDGQGLSGLARAFFYAGAGNLLVSHWPVRDGVAAQLTVGTIDNLKRDNRLSRSEALQLAMQAVRNDRSQDAAGATLAHPSAWAPFSLVGDGARR